MIDDVYNNNNIKQYFNNKSISAQYIKLNSNDSCKLLPSANSSLPIWEAPNWENIPGTLLLNSFIGSILFVSFLILTKIAWNRLESPDINLKQGLISFLYGYRDPQRWYCIPRFEFLRYKDRHHKHDMTYSNMYAPPKLPLANPIELFGNNYESKSASSSKSFQSKNLTTNKTILSNNTATKKTIKTIKSEKIISKQINNNDNINPSSIKELTLIKAPKTIDNQESTDDRTLLTRNSTQSSIDDSLGRSLLLKSPINILNKKLTTLDSSFFYPSILTAEQLQASYISRRLNSFFSIFFRVTDADIIYAKGIDAYEYLLFQRHLILIMFIINLFCLGVILPIHWYSNSNNLYTRSKLNNIDITSSFQRTTIKSVDSNSSFYWAHIISSICIVIITLFVLKSYRESTIAKTDTQLARRTLLIGNIPKNQRNRIELMKIFKEFFPRSSVEAIQFIYTTDLLERYQLQLDSILVAKDYCYNYKRKYKHEFMVKPTDVNENQVCYGSCRLCSFCYICCFNWPFELKQPGTIYYSKEEQNYREKIRLACEEMVKNPSDYAFVTFRSYNQAKRVIESLARLKAELFQDSSILTNKQLININSKNYKNSVKDPVINKIETKNNEFPPNDPLDPKNDPHVRSIRSPFIKVKIIEKELLAKVIDEKSAKQLEEKQNKLKKPNGNNNDNKIELVPKSIEQVKNQILTSYKSNPLDGPLRWSVRYAPHPDNVEFYDILHLATTSKFTIALYHLLMIIIFIFFTTPNVVLSILERLYVLVPDKAKELTGYQGLIINYVSILIQIVTTELLPTFITLISRQIPYENSASKNHSIMWKVYAFLILMVIIMPSIGMSSAQALISSEINPKCLFLTDNGAYYINYVISSIFLSTVSELLKPADVLFYSFILLTGRSMADFEGGRQYITNEFSVNMQHISVLLIFTVVMTYTISCPLIAPAGLVYLIVKHSVDRYHLNYTYFTKKVDESLQNTILIFVKLSLLLMLLQTTLAISINTGISLFTIVSQIAFWISLAIFVFDCFYELTSRDMISNKKNRYQRELCACFYTPRVIGDLLRVHAIPESCISRQV